MNSSFERRVDSGFIDTGTIAAEVKERLSGGADKVLELIGTITLKDSLRCAKQGGIVCMTGIVGNEWTFESFAPMEFKPTAVCLTSYAGEAEDFMRMPLQDLVDQIAEGSFDSDRGRRTDREDPAQDRSGLAVRPCGEHCPN